jgi:hypothetical protein
MLNGGKVDYVNRLFVKKLAWLLLPHRRSDFSYWPKKLKLHEQVSSEDLSTSEFTQLHFTTKQDQFLPVLEIEYASGVSIKFYKQPEASWIKQLL